MTDTTSKKRPRKIIPSLCRICLTGSYSMSKLSNFMDPQNTIPIVKALEKVMSCEVVIAKGVPNHLCSMCTSLLRISYDLRMQFEETQRKIWENIEKTTEVPKLNVEPPKPSREVDLIYGQENYSLSDILIVEEEERNEDYTHIIQNLGETVSVQCVEKNKDEATQKIDESIESYNNGNTINEDSETIIIRTESDIETKQAFHWEHEYAKSSPEPTRRVGRRSKYPELEEEINSLIIEGDIQKDASFEEENKKGRKRRKFTEEEMKEIEKYIIYIGNENQPVNNSKPNENLPHKSQTINNVIVKDFSLGKLTENHICHVCRVPFVTKGSLNRHLRVVHKLEIQKPKREKLPRELIRKRRLERMKQNYKKNPMLCQICGHVSGSSGGARYHLLQHSGKKIHCDLCPRTFFTPSHLKHHRQMKHEQKTRSKHLCTLCGEYRNSTTALAYHMKVHRNEEKKFSCHICGIKFVVKSALTMHLRRHNDDRRYPCTQCPKSFFSKNDLRKHAMIHTGEKPHQCRYCEKRFITSFNKRVHTMTHDGPYECDYCDKCFVDMDVLNMHYKYKHQISTGGLETIPSLSLTDDEDSNVSFNNPVPDVQILEGLELLQPEDDNLVFEED